MGQALQLTGESFVDGSHRPFLVGEHLDCAVASPVLLRRLALAREIVWMGNRRAPVVGESLEVGKRKPGKILPSDAHNPKLAQGIKQESDLCLVQRAAQVDTGEAHAGSAFG